MLYYYIGFNNEVIDEILTDVRTATVESLYISLIYFNKEKQLKYIINYCPSFSCFS